MCLVEEENETYSLLFPPKWKENNRKCDRAFKTWFLITFFITCPLIFHCICRFFYKKKYVKRKVFSIMFVIHILWIRLKSWNKNLNFFFKKNNFCKCTLFSLSKFLLYFLFLLSHSTLSLWFSLNFLHSTTILRSESLSLYFHLLLFLSTLKSKQKNNRTKQNIKTPNEW